MYIAASVKRQAQLLWRFLGFFQAPKIRLLHAMVVALVCWQLLSGWLIENPIPPGLVVWCHTGGGLLSVVIGGGLLCISLHQRGLRYFFPYMWGDLEQLKKDFRASMHLKMIAPRPKGLATTVQGLGMGALLLSLLSGLLWFILWRAGFNTHSMGKIHENVVVLIELYFLGHGTMAILHYVSWQKKTNPRV